MRGGMEVSCSLKQNLQQSRTTPYLVIYKSGAGRRGRARSSAVRGGSSWTNHSGRPCAVCGDVGPQCDEVPLSALHADAVCIFSVGLSGDISGKTGRSRT